MTRAFFSIRNLLVVALLATALNSAGAPPAALEIGIAVRDVTPDGPIWLAGYAARKRPSDQVDTPLLVQAMALRTQPGEPVLIVSVDNCEVSREFTAPVLDALGRKHGLGKGRVMIVSSHTHSGPVIDGPLRGMYQLSSADEQAVSRYGKLLREKLEEVVEAALEDLRPGTLEHGIGRATFAMNRRVYREDRVDFGENPEGPVDWDVPVLKVLGETNQVRAVVFGYACHGTSIAGDDFSIVSGDYMSYARQHLEAVYPGAVAIYLTGMGADSNPSPRGRLIDAKRHGLELAGAVAGVLSRPMRPVSGDIRFAYREAELPLASPPTRERLEADARGRDVYIKRRAQSYLERLDRGEPLPEAVKLPLSVIRIGDDLTLAAMGGEVVVDYALRLKRLLKADHPWLIGYAYEVPCYIPSIRILKEGGYEADYSLIYYGLYGPLRTQIEEILTRSMLELAESVRKR